MEALTEHLVAGICNSNSADAALCKFLVAHEGVADIRIMFATDNAGGVKLAATTNQTFPGGATVHGLFPTRAILILDRDTLGEVRTGPTTFAVDHSLSLDTMAVSYLRPFLQGATNHRLPLDMREVFDFIARPDVDVNPLPYAYENLANLGDKNRERQILDILVSYQILRTLDVDCLRTHGVVKSVFSDAQLAEAAQESIEGMRKRREEPEFYETLKFRHSYVYACLLKMAEIQLGRQSVHYDSKMAEFLDFCDKTLCNMPQREINLAGLYFVKRQALAFFGKIQKKRDDVLRVLKGMAWDILHVRHLEEMATLSAGTNKRCFLPALLTFDKRLVEVMESCPVKAVAFNCHSGGDLMTFYADDWPRCLASTAKGREEAMQKHYGQARREIRRQASALTRARMPAIVSQLEASVATFART